MNQESELQRLERFVAKLLANFSELRTENAHLARQLDERSREVEDLRGMLAAEQSERGEIGQRVGRLVEQIEEWEKSLVEAAVPEADFDEDAVAPEEDEDRVEYDVQAEYQDPEVEEDVSAASRGEDEGRVQHNLFSLTGSPR